MPPGERRSPQVDQTVVADELRENQSMSASNVLVTAPRCRRITAELAEVAGSFAGQVDMRPSTDLGERGEAISSATGLVLIDGHHTGPGLVDGLNLGWRDHCPGIKAQILIVGCCYSGESDFIAAVRAGLDRPVTYLGCDGIAPYRHARLVFIPVLRALLADSIPSAVDTAKDIINRALARTRAEHPRMTSLARWNASDLDPLK